MIPDSINGSESLAELDAPLIALVDFYHAFNSRNAEAAANNWARSEEVAMDNPIGGIRRGWDEIRAGYEKIMNGPAKVYVEFYDFSFHMTGEMYYVVGRERGNFRGKDEVIDLKIRTSRIFKKVGEQWKQVHHHGSIEDPELLLRYQQAVLPG